MATPTEQQYLKPTKNWLKKQKNLAGNLLTFSMVSSIAAGICLIVQAAILSYSVDQLVFKKSHWSELNTPLLALLGLMLIRAVLAHYTEYFAFQGATKIKLALRRELYCKLTQLGPAFIEQQHSAALTELLHQGVESLEEYYAKYLPAVAFCAIIPIAILAVVVPVDWLTGLIFLVTAPLIPLFMILIGLKAEQLNQQHWQQLSRMSNHFLDILQGLAQLKLFNASRAEAKAIASIADKYRRSTMSVLKVAFLSSFALEFLATLSVAMVAVTVGFRLYWGELDFAVGFMLLLLAPEFYQPFRQLGSTYHAKMKGVAAAEKMLEILQTEPSQLAEEPLQDKALTIFSCQPELTIEFNKVSFNYTKNRVALADVSLQITEPGLYAIIGPSGAGKSSLIDLLLGFLQPSSGTILINRQHLSRIERSSWQRQLAWVPQNPQLIYGSILENIQLADPNASIEQVKTAGAAAGVDRFVHQFACGWDHLIVEQGVGVSGGEKQRIAMARVFLKRAPILILDEPSAHLDAATANWLESTLEEYAKDHYVILISHRLNSIKKSKNIFLLDQGELLAQGTHRELLATSTLYKALHSAGHTE